MECHSRVLNVVQMVTYISYKYLDSSKVEVERDA